MKLLVDSHVFLWFVEGAPQLSLTARRLIEDPNNEILVSIASLWEIGIKVSTGKLTVVTSGKPFDVHITEQMTQNGFTVLPITLPHVFVITAMQFHHRDPSDRILAAQSLVDGIPIVSIDAVFDAYGVERLW